MKGWLLSAAALTSLCALGCQQVGLSAPPDATVTLTASTRTLPPNGGVAELLATVLNSEATPVADGTLVYFFATLGSVDESAETINGVARATFRSTGTEGAVLVTAVSGNAMPASIDLTIGVAELTLMAMPGSLPAGGGQVVIVARVADSNDQGVEGKLVVFSIRSGGSSARLASGGAAVTTDGTGRARDTLTTDEQTTVRAVVLGSELSGEITLSEDSSTSVASVLVTASPAPIPFGSTTSEVTARVFDSGGRPVVGAPVGFSVTTPGTMAPINVVSDSRGEARSTLTTPADDPDDPLDDDEATATVTVTASADGVSGRIDVARGTASVRELLLLSVSHASVFDLTDPGPDPCGASANPQLPLRLRGVLTALDGSPIDGASVELEIEDVTTNSYDGLGGICPGLDKKLTVTTGTAGPGTFELMYTLDSAEMALCPASFPNTCSAKIIGRSGASADVSVTVLID